METRMAEESYIQKQIRQSEGAKRRRERSGGGSSVSPAEREKKRKYEAAVEAGVDPERAQFAFDYVPEGKTRVVTVQSKQGVGVNVTRGGSGQRTTREVLDRRESERQLGVDYAIPTDDRGRTRTDALIERRTTPQYADFGPLRYAGRADPFAPRKPSDPRTAVGVGARTFPVDLPVYGRRQFDSRPVNVVRPARERPNIGVIPDLIEDPAREFGRGFRETIRTPGEAGPNIRTRSPAYALGGTAAIVSGIGAVAGTPQAAGARLGLTSMLGRTGAVAATGTAAVAAPSISSQLSVRDRELLRDPRFQSAFRAGRQARREDLGFGLGLVENVPGVGPKVVDLRTGGRSREAFEQAFAAEAARTGLPRDSVRTGLLEFESRQRGGGAGIVIGQIPGEIVGRTVFRGAGVISRPGTRAFVSTLPAGALEGGLIYATERESERLPARPRDFAISAGLGALTAGASSGFIVGNIAARRARGQAGRVFMNIIDPAEIGGDVGADILTGAPRMSPRITTVPPDLTFTRVFDQTGTPRPRQTFASRFQEFTGRFSTGRTRTTGRTPAPSDNLPSVLGETGVSRVRQPDVNVPVRSPTGSRSPVPTLTPTPQVPVQPRPNVPVQVTPQVPTFAPTLTPAVTPRVPVTPFTRVPVFPNVYTPTFTDFPIGAFPGGGGQRGGRGFNFFGRRRRGVRNLPSLTAAARSDFDPVASFTGLQGKRFTGLEIRGLTSRKKKKSRQPRVSLL
jgi:hypothetical protein